MSKKLTFQEIISKLHEFWASHGCLILQPIDLEVGAGTFHPATFLRSLGPEPWRAAHVQPSRRPTDGRYGKHPNRGQHFFQYQVVLKPSPKDIQEMYLDSLKFLGINTTLHDIRFVEDNWEGPTLGAWGLGWEVWLDGMEITQFTYFQQVGGLECKPVTGELAYGVARLAMYLQDVEDTKDLVWTYDANDKPIYYGDIYLQDEREMSIYNFELANVDMLFRHFDDLEAECKSILDKDLAIPAYEMVMKVSHIFNILDARKAISVTERQAYILRVRNLAKSVAEIYYKNREALGFPLLKKKV